MIPVKKLKIKLYFLRDKNNIIEFEMNVYTVEKREKVGKEQIDGLFSKSFPNLPHYLHLTNLLSLLLLFGSYYSSKYHLAHHCK